MTRKVGDWVHFFFLFGIKRPEVERNVPWMCPPRRPPQSDPTGGWTPPPQASLPTELDFAQSCQKGTKIPSTPVSRNDCAAKTVAPKRGRQKLPEGKVEISPSPPNKATPSSWKDGKGSVSTTLRQEGRGSAPHSLE